MFASVKKIVVTLLVLFFLPLSAYAQLSLVIHGVASVSFIPSIFVEKYSVVSASGETLYSSNQGHNITNRSLSRGLPDLCTKAQSCQGATVNVSFFGMYGAKDFSHTIHNENNKDFVRVVIVDHGGNVDSYEQCF